ncbi:MAG: DUF1329 domain-containing protein [Nevskia sp.]
MTRRLPILLVLLGVCAVCAAAADPVARLDTELTPLGALRAGNADGSIPAWDGGLTPERAPAGFVAGSRYADPWPDEQPLFAITGATAATHAARLTPGQLALLAALPDSYALPVYASHRSAAAPAAFYAGTRSNAANAKLLDDGGLKDAVSGLPFPLLGDEPDDGLRLYWNQRLRWRGLARDRILIQASIAASGEVTRLRVHERLKFMSVDSPPSKALGRALSASLMAVIEPRRLLGLLKLEQEFLDGPILAWQRSPGPDLPQLRKTSEAGNDTPVIGSNGLLDEDQREGYAGAADRYRWKRLGTREIYVPYNAYRLHAAGTAGGDVLAARHPDPARLRYELHRVQVLDARLKPNLPGAWPRRTFYVDEDSSQILLVDLYGRDDRIQQVQEVHTLMAYDRSLLLPVVDAVYDLAGRRYLLAGLDDGDAEIHLDDLDAGQFTPDAARRWARTAGAAPPK